MRVAFLKENLVGPSFAYLNPPKGGCVPLAHEGWGLLTPRVPLLATQTSSRAGLIVANPLDQGFFFPLPTHEISDGAPYKKLVMWSRKPARPTNSIFRVASYWEALEGVEANLLEAGQGPEGNDLGEEYTSSRLLSFFAGARPKPREYPLTGRGEALPSEENFDSEEDENYVRGLRLLSRGAKGSNQEKSSGGARRKPIAYSGLKLPPHWPQSRVEEEHPQKSGAPKLSFYFRRPSQAYLTPKGGLGADLAGLSALAKKKAPALPHRLSRIVQTRYKPGLSKWWRLLRLHFCLSWGLPWLRQRRLTNYVSQLSHVTGLNFVRMCTASIGFVVKASFLVGTQLLVGDKAFVNGIAVRNPFFQVYKGDRVSLLTPTMPSNHRWKALTASVKVAPLKGWEVDGLSKAVSVWSEPTALELQTFSFNKPVPFLTFRMYNWKYRH